MTGSARFAGAGFAAVGVVGAAWAVAAGLSAPGLLRTPEWMFLVITWVALCAVGACAPTVYRSAASWAALSLVGFGLSLQFVDAGTRVVYQHLRPAVAPIGPGDWVVAGALAAYGAVVLLGLAPRALAIRGWVAARIGVGRAVVAVVVWAAIGASPLRDLSAYALEIGLAAALAVVALGAVVLAAMSLPAAAGAYIENLIDLVLGGDPTSHGRRLDRVALACSLFVTVVSAALAYWIWEAHPRISDEMSFLFQAQYFARGSLAAPGVPVPELFDAYQIECNALRCLSVLQPGWPALLAPGVKLGVPWLINPILAGMNTYLFFVFLRELYGLRLARGATTLLACSPWHLFLGMSYMNHQAALLGGLVGVLGATLAVRRMSVAWASLAGVGAGFASLIRPLDGVIVGVVAGLPILLLGPARPLRRLSASVMFGAFAVLLGSLNLAYNYAVTGNPMDFPVTSYVNRLWGERSNNLGFGPDRGIYPLWSQMDAFPGHSPFQAVVNAGLNISALQVELFGWAMGSFLPLLLLIFLGKVRRIDWLMIAWFGVINALYALYWFASGPDFAARYWFLGIVPLVALTARGIAEVAARVEAAAGRRGRAFTGVALALLAAQTLLVFLPWRATDKYFHYWETRPALRASLAEDRLPDGIYLVRGRNHPDYAGAMIYTGPELAGGDIVFAYDSLPNSAELLNAAFPGRRVWLMDGPSITGSVYQVVGAVNP